MLLFLDVSVRMVAESPGRKMLGVIFVQYVEFVKMTKIIIEIDSGFVYNVRIAV